MASYKAYLKNVETSIGLTKDQIRKKSPYELAKYFENKTGKKFKLVSKYPTVGRGNILWDRLISSDEINKEIDKILKI